MASYNLNYRKIAYAKRDSYVEGKGLLFGLKNLLIFLKTVPSKSANSWSFHCIQYRKVYEERVKLGEYLYYREK